VLRLREVRETLQKTTFPRNEKQTEERLTVWLATYILSQATIAASETDPEDLFLEWVTMHDTSVRTAHRDTDGQVRPIGVSFDVDGSEMPFPGWPGAPIELWINCRCTLRPTLAEESLTAGGTMSETETEQVEATPGAVPWYGVLAPEGIPSGDKRMFANNALRTRPLPLPMTWQKSTTSGHDNASTVARIDRIVRVPVEDGFEARGVGVFLTNPEADEAIGLIADFSRYGVSIDADDTAFELDEENEMVVFTDSRVAGAAIVGIPAFHQAFIALGEPPEGFMDGEDLASEGSSLMDEEALVAALSFDRAEVFKDLAPGKTEDGPGWLTHPVDTDRLRDYWVRGEGAAKIGWGTAGDFNRCRLAVAEYVKPQYLNGYCANRHYDALGFWPGRPVSGDVDVFADREGDPAEAISLVASNADEIVMPHGWFTMEEPDEITHFTVTEEGQVFGHAAAWNECHGAFLDTCVLPPKSYTNYAYYNTGHVLTDQGVVATGRITVSDSDKHAPDRMSMRAAIDHYDKTGSVVADVVAVDGKHGIWVCGAIRPTATPEQVYTLRASDVSGDWRQPGWGQEKELIAIKAVNKGGFNTPRVAAAIRDGQVISLVAAGYIARPPEQEQARFDNASIERMADLLAEQVAQALENRKARKARMEELALALEGSN
jgi:hypothetical protein